MASVKVNVKRYYCINSFCHAYIGPMEDDGFACKNCPISHEHVRRYDGFTCKNCPISHEHVRRCFLHKKCLSKTSNLSKCCAVTEKDPSTSEYNLSTLPSLIQKRFFETANPYQKYKLQYVNQQFNKSVPANTFFEVYERMIIDKIRNLDESQYGKFRNGIYLNPRNSEHIELLKDVLINNELFGNEVPDGWILKACSNNVMFYLETIRMEKCNLSSNEINAICSFGMEFEHDWPMAFLEYINGAVPAKLHRITIKNVSFNMDPKAFNRFVKERIIRDKTELDWTNNYQPPKTIKPPKEIHIAYVITLTFNPGESKGKFSKKDFLKKLQKTFGGFYTNVTKTEFAKYKLNEKFVVERNEPIKKRKAFPYPPRAERIDRYFYVDASVAEVTKQMNNLQI
uniref:F-box domain-containing protein n=1 Tax=Panagrolaimus sp. PS1159 TaxID=55785 RepID=A0AC35EV18_9BILA